MPVKESMQSLVVEMLENELPVQYCYHNIHHTLFVQEHARSIGLAENCTPAELGLIDAAALWHDTGYIRNAAHHEEIGCGFVRSRLPDFGYSEADIEIICGMIMATKIPQSPRNLLEAVIADADLAYLGTDTAAAQAEKLLRELQNAYPGLTREKWNKTQLIFLRTHQYFTRYGREQLEPGKQAYLQSLTLAGA